MGGRKGRSSGHAKGHTQAQEKEEDVEVREKALRWYEMIGLHPPFFAPALRSQRAC